VTASTNPTAGPYSIYTGRATNWPVVLVSAVLLVPLGVAARSQQTWWDVAVPMLVFVAFVALYALTGSSVRTTAGPQGVSIHFGLLGWPRAGYRLDEIERAEVIDLAPWYVSFGFWWTPWRTCCTVRSGPTLRLLLRNGRTVTVTTSRPDAAVAAVHEAKAG
jgi:hypothetical protein